MTSDSTVPAPGLTRRAGLGLIAAAAASPALAAGPPSAGWTTAWAATLQRQAKAPQLAGATLRNHALLSQGGEALRVRLSNEFGGQPLKIGAASILVSGRTIPLVFGGARGLVIPPGAPALSDPVDIACKALDPVEVSLFLPEPTSLETFRRSPTPAGGRISGAGDFTGPAPFTTAQETYLSLLSAVEVRSDRKTPGLVIFGDTKSVGHGNWADLLIQLTGGRIAVANRSMYAGLLALGPPGDSGLARFDRDVLSVAGATHMLLFTGNNDLIQPGAVGSGGRPLLDPALTQSTAQLIEAQEQALDRARAAGLKVIGGTWLPYDGVAIEGYSTPEKAAKRQAVNAWMRGDKRFDRVIDFEAALRDPARPGQLLAAYDSGNHFTPSDAGYKKMAEAAWAVLKTLV